MSTSLDSLRERFRKDVTPLDIAAGILFFFGKIEFTTSYERLNSAFYKEKDNPLLGEFRFREGGSYPYSALLENVFSRLSKSGLISCLNPDYRLFEIGEKQLERIEKGVLKKFSKEKIRDLKSLSQRIKKNLGPNNSRALDQ
ncbi:MAG: hypothetical protein E3J41_00370 [Candidatus Cloacimonadota bacterium]|nr:MAG: hypothetical protein E3J41_00370 [Candidatus Cloacimonadota bacterium]